MARAVCRLIKTSFSISFRFSIFGGKNQKRFSSTFCFCTICPSCDYLMSVWENQKRRFFPFICQTSLRWFKPLMLFSNQISSTANVYKIDNFSLVIIKHLSSVIATYPSKTVFVKISRQSYSPPPRPIIPLLNMKLRNWYKTQDSDVWNDKDNLHLYFQKQLISCWRLA